MIKINGDDSGVKAKVSLMAEVKSIPIIKASGEIVQFNQPKLHKSLKRSGATERQIQEIIEQITHQLYPGIPTKKIYQLAFKLLHKYSKPYAARYKLKSAIMELGPSGFPFEKYISTVFSHWGYTVQTGLILQGRCVDHEVDVLARKGDEYVMVECKYHNHRGIVCDVKVPLYIKSRFKDIEEKLALLPENKMNMHQGWVVTNTRFTDDAIQYGNCAGLKLLGWDYPKKGSLNQEIERLGLYPITCLTTITKHEKGMLLARRIVLCKEICDTPELLNEVGINQSRIPSIFTELNQLCQKHNVHFQ